MITFEFEICGLLLKSSTGDTKVLRSCDKKSVREAALSWVKDHLLDEAEKLVVTRENTYGHSGFNIYEYNKRMDWCENTMDKIRSCISHKADTDAFLRQYGYVLDNIRNYLYPHADSRYYKNFNFAFKELESTIQFYFKSAQSEIVKTRKNPPVFQTSLF
ncbi:hypothetical protein LJC53_02950 [Bacteroidales bacterium OttesenSCG-928-C03]|nr:hypothetical protein [Bacteroidales bacterium OttesenSCG-928-C03]MDL2326150.1 hypothetical protein [Bacteroidales bacterium OttesenSCG-928-A14]